MNCKKCNSEINTRFCPNCGQPSIVKRIDGKYIVHEIEHIVHFEHGLLYTIKELITNPGQNIRNYLSESRSRLVKPVVFIIITSLLYTVSIHFFHIADQYIKFEGDAASTVPSKIFKWIENNYGYTNIIVGLFITLWIKLFFRKYHYNAFEVLILLCFVMGIAMLIYALFALIQGLTNLKVMAIGGIIGIGYCSWAIGHFFGKDKIVNYIKALFAYILGLLSFALTALVLGFILQWMIGR